ncbi:WecB/TagA/CpsF family glycosyltransferase [Erysipelothrix anatis]|uniref:WecB/TagA/CpsF family glycosyltransferase n=1 Tax=Erysipelothrix anatis TaxID=2683713 RepID=UPI0019158138|nr:WecB/TagA/CpsF family glycosyltransferase [Erysipelothrix anatis]
MNDRLQIFNTHVNNLTMDETILRVEEIVKRGVPTQHVVINASKVNLMREDARLTEIVNSCELINADGASILWAAKQFGFELKERVTGIDLFQNLLPIAEKKEYSIYLFGAQQKVVSKVSDMIREQYPEIKIVGTRNGYFNEEESDSIVESIAASGADMLFVAFSSPMKEYWISENLEKLNVPFIMGVGGSFDVLAGVTDRAPIWMQDSGLEWFYRFIQEPRRMWKRYIVGNFKFVMYTKKMARLNKRKEKQLSK